MATSFKTLLDSDIINSRNYLHESVPIVGTIVSGTYNNKVSVGANQGVEYNIKNFGHGMFQSVYDYPYLSSSANHIFDLTVGMYPGYSDDPNIPQIAEKNNMYNQMAQLLVGYDTSGSIKKFSCPDYGTVYNSCVFMPISRLLVKDEIKKGTFSLEIYVTGSSNSALELAGNGDISGGGSTAVTFSDSSGSTSNYTNSPAGEYGVLYGTEGVTNTHAVGLIYYQAGIAVLSTEIFATGSCGNGDADATGVDGYARLSGSFIGGGTNITNSLLASGSIINYADAVRHRLKNVSFNNTTELNSTIYFARANANEFNYSSNPTYLSASKIHVKSVAADPPVSYITTVGLYGTNNELLATAKLSEPLKKTPSNEFTLRVRLDY
jgi:hypothetical protein